MEELDIIVFPGDAVFEAVIDKKNTYVLRFEMDEERYFFWLQVRIWSFRIRRMASKLLRRSTGSSTT